MDAAKGNGLTAGNSQPAKVQNTNTHIVAPARFTGTDNPRHLRAIAGLLRRPMPRESLDHEAGCSNAPELMAELRRRGLDAPCERISFIDRDGRQCRPGVYSFTLSDRRKVYAWMTKRKDRTNG